MNERKIERVVYIAHPCGEGPEKAKNRERAARWVCWAARNFNVSPVADWITLTGEEIGGRDHGLLCDVALVRRCDEIWLVGGRVSTGMQIEADAARETGLRIVDLTALGEEPPSLTETGLWWNGGPLASSRAHEAFAQISLLGYRP